MKVNIIGGGAQGIAIAALLKRSLNHISDLREGSGFYNEVTILERGEALASDTSAIVSEAHVGTEYPTPDEQGKSKYTSAFDCLKGLIEMKKIAPKEVFADNDDKYTKFLISKKTHDKGEFTVEKYREFLEALKQEYSRLVDLDSENKVLGEVGDFYRELLPDEYQDAQEIAAGFLCKQEAIIMPRFIAIMQEVLKESGVKVKCNKNVGNFEKEGDKFVVKLSGEEREESDLLVVAANHGGFKLVKGFAGANYKASDVHAGLRAIVIVNPEAISSKLQNKESTMFTLHGTDGGMLNTALGLAYHPDHDGSWIDDAKMTDDNPSLPEKWFNKDGSLKADTTVGRKIINNLKAIYPALEGLEEKDFKVVFKVGIRQEASSERRSDPGITSINMPGQEGFDLVSANFTVKLTHVFKRAEDVTKNILGQLLTNEKITQEEYAAAVKVVSNQIEMPAIFKKDRELLSKKSEEIKGKIGYFSSSVASSEDVPSVAPKFPTTTVQGLSLASSSPALQ